MHDPAIRTSREPAPATLLAQALGHVDAESGALSPALVVTSTYERDADNAYRRGFSYGRDDNPTVALCEALLARIEGAPAAAMFASGMAAATALFQSLPAGTHVLAPKVMYWGLRHWLLVHAQRQGLALDLVDMDQLDLVRAAVRPGVTGLIWVETPANPTWVVSDIAGLAGIAEAAGARLAVDNTVPTPLLTRPLDLGADFVMHSTTKALNGHSDALGGVLLPSAAMQDGALWSAVRALRHDQGAIIGPFEAWLTLRGMRTLHLRHAAACGNAMHLAAALERHPAVERVRYPGLPSHRGHTLAARQMRGGFGAMLSIEVRGGAAAAIAAAARVRLWKRATSLGGVESLIEHRASIEGAGSPVPPGLLRLAVGCEDAGDLLADLDEALQAAPGRVRPT